MPMELNDESSFFRHLYFSVTIFRTIFIDLQLLNLLNIFTNVDKYFTSKFPHVSTLVIILFSDNEYHVDVVSDVQHDVGFTSSNCCFNAQPVMKNTPDPDHF